MYVIAQSIIRGLTSASLWVMKIKVKDGLGASFFKMEYRRRYSEEVYNEDFLENINHKHLTFFKLVCSLSIASGANTAQNPTGEWEFKYFWVNK